MAKFTPKPGFRFPADPPKEALEFFRGKGYKIGFDHRDVWREEHAAAFTVAKAMNLDVLSAIRGEVDKALAEGRTFRQFKADLEPTLQRLGWWGAQPATDPKTGKTAPAQLGSPRRLKIIYRTNLRTARAAGQWERIERGKKSHPFLIYRLGPSEVHRPMHVSWAGKILPVDDAWWSTHYPPNGWGCKCHVRQASRREAEKLGGPHRAPRIRTVEWKNKRTGKTERVPEGIDPGWDTHHGKTRRAGLGQALEDRKEEFREATGRGRGKQNDRRRAGLRRGRGYRRRAGDPRRPARGRGGGPVIYRGRRRDHSPCRQDGRRRWEGDSLRRGWRRHVRCRPGGRGPGRAAFGAHGGRRAGGIRRSGREGRLPAGLQRHARRAGAAGGKSPRGAVPARPVAKPGAGGVEGF